MRELGERGHDWGRVPAMAAGQRAGGRVEHQCNGRLCHQAKIGSRQKVMSPWRGLPRSQRNRRSTMEDLSMALRGAR